MRFPCGVADAVGACVFDCQVSQSNVIRRTWPVATHPSPHRPPFGLLVQEFERRLAESVGRDRAGLGPLALLLLAYLGRIFRGLDTLYAGFKAQGGAQAGGGEDDLAAHSDGAGAGAVPGASSAQPVSHMPERPRPGAAEAPPRAGPLLRPLWRMMVAEPPPKAPRRPGRARRTPRTGSPPEPPATAAASSPGVPPRRDGRNNRATAEPSPSLARPPRHPATLAALAFSGLAGTAPSYVLNVSYL